MSEPIRYFYKGKEADFIIFVNSEELVEEYLKNPAPSKLTEVVSLFQIFSNQESRGSEGELGEASKLQLENEFGKKLKEEELIDLILKSGKPLSHANVNRKKFSSTNDANIGM
ncbi:unnamed protein product [Kluyveromyces dobzhanskii CBS 2104]|uniref:WGS project CCBQ000000000 data, contig 00058 n=1 Tax=Kluyveromyces dobzhanskii CBS 2104 TaxID=1427455 RepID=A0A0A8LBB3_9SACH|nr:unnamed protein product [Kluyveromyces dobzhanskii CBS 2104]